MERPIFRIIAIVFVVAIIFCFYITRDGKVITPIGEGKLTLDSGIYEEYPLPDYASSMINSDYKSYFIEVEPVLRYTFLRLVKGFLFFSYMEIQPLVSYIEKLLRDCLEIE